MGAFYPRRGKEKGGRNMVKAIIGVVVLVMLFAFVSFALRSDNGIHAVGKNCVLIEGEVITLNWDATDSEVEQALALWRELR